MIAVALVTCCIRLCSISTGPVVYFVPSCGVFCSADFSSPNASDSNMFRSLHALLMHMLCAVAELVLL